MKVKTYLRGDRDRPPWAKLADELIAEAAPKKFDTVEHEYRTNMFLQTWHPSTNARSTLPQSLCNMISVAKKHNVDMNPPKPDEMLKRSMPIWYHKGRSSGRRQVRTTPYTKCQRATHNIHTTGDMQDYVETYLPPEHRIKADCSCETCVVLRARGCQNPAQCMKSAKTP